MARWVDCSFYVVVPVCFDSLDSFGTVELINNCVHNANKQTNKQTEDNKHVCLKSVKAILKDGLRIAVLLFQSLTQSNLISSVFHDDLRHFMQLGIVILLIKLVY